LQTNLNECYP